MRRTPLSVIACACAFAALTPIVSALLVNDTTSTTVGAIGCCSGSGAAISKSKSKSTCDMTCVSHSSGLDVSALYADVEGFCSLTHEVELRNLRISFDVEWRTWPEKGGTIGAIRRLGGIYLGTSSMVTGPCKKKCGLVDWIERFGDAQRVRKQDTGVRIHGFKVPWHVERVSPLAEPPKRWILEFDAAYSGLLRADGYIFSTFWPRPEYRRGYIGFWTCCSNSIRISNLNIETGVDFLARNRVRSPGDSGSGDGADGGRGEPVDVRSGWSGTLLLLILVAVLAVVAYNALEHPSLARARVWIQVRSRVPMVAIRLALQRLWRQVTGTGSGAGAGTDAHAGSGTLRVTGRVENGNGNMNGNGAESDVGNGASGSPSVSRSGSGYGSGSASDGIGIAGSGTPQMASGSMPRPWRREREHSEIDLGIDGDGGGMGSLDVDTDELDEI